jgi:hypothetical protein
MYVRFSRPAAANAAPAGGERKSRGSAAVRGADVESRRLLRACDLF